MKELLTPEIIAIVVVAAMIIVAVFFAFVANRVAGIDGKVTDLTEDIHKHVEKQISALAQGLHDDVKDSRKDLEESLNQMGDSWRSTLQKTVSDVQGEIGKLKSDLGDNSSSLRESLMEVITDNATNFNEQLAFVRDTHGQAIQDYQRQLAQQVREHAKGERELLTTTLNDLSASFGANLTELSENQRQVLSEVSGTVGEGYKTLADKVGKDIDDVTGDARKSVDSMTKNLDNKVTKAGAKLSSDLAEIAERVSKDMDDVSGMVDVRLTDVSSSLSDNVESLSASVKEEMSSVTENVSKNMNTMTDGVSENLTKITDDVNKNWDSIEDSIDKDFSEIGKKIDSRISTEMEKMLALFRSFADRVDVIEATREQILTLAGNVDVLAKVLDDRRGRGNIGEVVIESIVKDNLPQSSYEMNATLSNGVTVDCLLKLPEPSGMVAISTKINIEELETISGPLSTEKDVDKARKSWHAKLKDTVEKVASECIVEGETAEGAILLMPTESAFSEAHVHHRDLVDEAYKNRVWLASPSTLIAMVTVARAVVKDASARKEIDLVQAELHIIEDDYSRLETDIQKLTRDVDDMLTTATETRKAANRIGTRLNHVNGMISPPPAVRIAHSKQSGNKIKSADGDSDSG